MIRVTRKQLRVERATWPGRVSASKHVEQIERTIIWLLFVPVFVSDRVVTSNL